MAILSFDRIPRIPPLLESKLREGEEAGPELGIWLQDLVVFLYEWRRKYDQEIGQGGGELTVEDEGVAVGTAGGITTIDFVGAAVTATGSGADATVTISASSPNLTVEDEGSAVGTAGGITTIDFVGAGVVATGSGANATVTISGSGGAGGFDWGKYIAGRHGFATG